MISRFARLSLPALVSTAIGLSPIAAMAVDPSPTPAPAPATATDTAAQSDKVAEKKAQKQAKKDKNPA